MSSGANLIGFDEVMRNLEIKLGDSTIKRKTNKALRDCAKEIEPEFKQALSIYRRTGETVESTVYSRVSSVEGVPTVKLGFGAGSRWRLVHLSEFGYSKKKNPRGLGVIRKFYESQKEPFKGKIESRLREIVNG